MGEIEKDEEIAAQNNKQRKSNQLKLHHKHQTGPERENLPQEIGQQKVYLTLMHFQLLMVPLLQHRSMIGQLHLLHLPMLPKVANGKPVVMTGVVQPTLV